MKFYKSPRYPYWSNSTLVRKIQGKQKPEPLKLYTLDEMFAELDKPTPVFEKLVDKLQDICMLPIDLAYSVKIYYKNSKGNTHVLDGGLGKGEWYDLTYRIPVCLFNELVKYIEQEKGIETLEWEKTLVYSEDMGYDESHELYGKPTPQALSAIEQQEIYDWWKVNKDRDFYEESVKSGQKMLDLEEVYSKEETEMLTRLIEIRGSLWT